MATAALAERIGPYSYASLLGLRVSTLRDLLRAIERGLPFSAIERLHRSINLEVEEIAALVQIPRRTLNRRRHEGRFLPEESDRLVSAARLMSKAIDLFEGNADAAKRWLLTPQTAFGGAMPFDVAKSEIWAREVETLIDRLEQGIFS
jgi:putative toxin-antitoxin system antitoxin component (TIGR02293 family)